VNHSQNYGDGAADTGAAQFTVSANGTLAYFPGSINPEIPWPIVRVDRQGHEEPLPVEKKEWLSVRVSKDGRQLLLSTVYPPMGLWLYDLERKALRRESFDGWAVVYPQWGPEPGHFTFSSDQEGPLAFFSKAADSGPGTEQKLFAPGGEAWVSSWHPDGKHLAFVLNTAKTGPAIWILSREGTAAPLIQSGFQETFPEFSPDGRWLAYTSNESGRLEVYVRPYPGPGNVIQISTEEGRAPAWSRDGHEIYFQSMPDPPRRKFLVAKIEEHGGALTVAAPIFLFAGEFEGSSPVRGYDVTPDGHILIPKGLDAKEQAAAEAQTFPNHIRVVQNWVDELERLSPVR